MGAWPPEAESIFDLGIGTSNGNGKFRALGACAPVASPDPPLRAPRALVRRANTTTEEWVGPQLVGSWRDFTFSLDCLINLVQVQHRLFTIRI